MAQAPLHAERLRGHRAWKDVLLVVLLAVLGPAAFFSWGREKRAVTVSLGSTAVRSLPSSLHLAHGKINAAIQDGWNLTVLRDFDLKRGTGDVSTVNLQDLPGSSSRAARPSASKWEGGSTIDPQRSEKLPRGEIQRGRKIIDTLQSSYIGRTARKETEIPPTVALFPNGRDIVWAHDRILYWTTDRFSSGMSSPDQVSPLELRSAKLDSRLTALYVTDAGRLAIAYADSHVEILDAALGKVIVSQRTNGVPRVFCGQGRSLAVLSDSAVLLFTPDSAKPSPARQLEWKSRALTVAVSPRGRVAVGMADGELLLFPAPEDKKAETRTISSPGPVRALSFLDEDRLIAGGEFQGLALLEAEGGVTFIAAPTGVGLLAVEGDRVAFATNEQIQCLGILFAQRVSNRGAFIAAIWALFVASIAVVAIVRRRSRLGAKDIERTNLPQQTPEQGSVRLPLLHPPDDLIRACQDGECVLYAGAGLSAQAGLPTWSLFIRGLIDWSMEQGFIKAEMAESLVATVAEGQVDAAADAIFGTLDENGKSVLRDHLTSLFAMKTPGLVRAHRLLRDIPFAATLTTNFDDLLEQVWPGLEEDVLTPRDTDRLREMLARRSFFILKLYGTLQRPETLLLAPAEYAYATRRSVRFAEVIQGLFVSRTLLFLGSSLEGIEAYLNPLSLGSVSSRSHYALVDVQGTAWQTRADVLRRRYGIVVLPYTATAKFPELPAFLDALIAAVKLAKSEQLVIRRASGAGDQLKGLKRVRLVNIGPFEDLQLDLNSSWNVLLGDNGVGKSTILKAIAAGLCGRDSEPYAARLIRTGEPSGMIVLETATTVYQIEIRRRDTGAEISVSPAAPLTAEGWLAIGFPPLRTTTWGRSRGPTAEGRWSPNAQDLLPLINGEPDPRMDQIKQWIVNLDARMHDLRGDATSSEASKRLLSRFSETIDEITPGLVVRFSRVDRETYQVWMKTDDGEVPIEAISQGTVSLISWIGVLLARFFEVYPDAEDPTKGYALVLIDELDAHMHPEWQQSVVDDLQRIFPNAQFVVTTHSPLVVGGLPANQVIRFQRGEDGRIARTEVSPEMTMGRADQVLTSGLFGLRTTLDTETLGLVEEYKEKLGATHRTKEEEDRFQELRKALQFRIPLSPETPPERKALELVQAILRHQRPVGGGAMNEDLLRVAKELIDELGRRGKQA
jgi:hypothetical protein